MGDLGAGSLEHDDAPPPQGSRAARRDAAAARPSAAHALTLVQAEPRDRVRRGSGWDNVPRPITRCCVAEQRCLDSMVVRVEDHALACALATRTSPRQHTAQAAARRARLPARAPANWCTADTRFDLSRQVRRAAATRRRG